MRNAVLQVPKSRNANEQRQVLRAAIRQLERADVSEIRSRIEA